MSGLPGGAVGGLPDGDAVALPRPLAGRRIVLGVTGSIAAYRAFEIARRLQRRARRWTSR